MKSIISSIAIVLILIVLFFYTESMTALKTTPEDGEIGFPIEGEFIIKFNYTMDKNSVEWDVTPDPIYPFVPEWTDDNLTLTLKPTVKLLEDTNYTILVTGDYEDETLGSVDVSFSFTTETDDMLESDDDESSILIVLLIVIVIIIIIVLLLFIIVKRKTINN